MKIDNELRKYMKWAINLQFKERPIIDNEKIIEFNLFNKCWMVYNGTSFSKGYKYDDEVSINEILNDMKYFKELTKDIDDVEFNFVYDEFDCPTCKKPDDICICEE